MRVLDDDVKFEAIMENFNEYDLSNGDVMNVKTVVVQVIQLDQHNEEGEPIYNINTQPLIKII